MIRYLKSQNGQTIIILLLVMVVGLTIGLSMVSRSLTDIKISQQAEQSQRAFSAAEAGLEYGLSQGLAQIAGGDIPQTIITPGVSYSGKVSRTGKQGYELKGLAAIEQDDVAQINLDPADLEAGGTSATSLNIYWGEVGTTEVPSTPCPSSPNPGSIVASLELTFITQNGTSYGVVKHAYNACTSIETANNFIDPSQSNLPTPTPPSTETVYYAKIDNLAIPANAKILRIRPLYNKASVKIEPQGGILPNQAYKLTVKGEAQGKVRAIEWQQPIKPALPAIFDYVLFSGSSTNALQKN